MVHLANRCLLREHDSVKPTQVGDVADEHHRAGDLLPVEQGQGVDEHRGISASLHLLEHRGPHVQQAIEGLGVQAEVRDGATLGWGVEANAVQGVHRVGRGELHPPRLVEHHEAVAHPWGPTGAEHLVSEGEGALGDHGGEPVVHVGVHALVQGGRATQGSRNPHDGPDAPALEDDGDVLDRHLFTDLGVVRDALDGASRANRLGRQRPLACPHRLAHEVLDHEGGAVVGAHLP